MVQMQFFVLLFRDPNVPVKEKKTDDEEMDKEEIDIKGKGKGKGIFVLPSLNTVLMGFRQLTVRTSYSTKIHCTRPLRNVLDHSDLDSPFLESKRRMKLSNFPGLWIRIHFLRIRIRIQSLMLEANTDPDPNPIRIQGLNDQNMKKN